MYSKIVIAALAAAVSVPASSQSEGPMPLPVQRADMAPQGNASLPANTEVLLQMTQEVSTKGKQWKEGDQFKLSVVKPVMLGDYVVIPEGAPAFGRITWLTDKGMFGKSGKMDIELEYVEVAGRRLRIDGTYRQEGEGNTLATVGGVIAAGPFAAFITGRSGRIPVGRELMATTEESIELAIPAAAVHREMKQATFAPTNAGQAVITSSAEADVTAEAAVELEGGTE